MGWRGAIRSMAAAQRRYEREAVRKQRLLEKQRQQLGKLQELERAAFEVEEYENRIDLLLSVHRDCSPSLNWDSIKRYPPPTKPSKRNTNEERAQRALDRYDPSAMSKLLGRAKRQREELSRALEEARKQDEREYEISVKDYERAYADWEEQQELAAGVLAGNREAFVDVINEMNPFSDIGELGSYVRFNVASTSLIEAHIQVNGERVVPSHIKALLKSGKLSVKEMPKSRFFELYQDYVCGCVLRVARELFALLPIEMAIVTAEGAILNASTGHMENRPILSVAIPRETLSKLNFDTLDPSDALSNFLHRMDFKKGRGFAAVERIEPSELQKPASE